MEDIKEQEFTIDFPKLEQVFKAVLDDTKRIILSRIADLHKREEKINVKRINSQLRSLIGFSSAGAVPIEKIKNFFTELLEEKIICKDYKNFKVSNEQYLNVYLGLIKPYYYTPRKISDIDRALFLSIDNLVAPLKTYSSKDLFNKESVLSIGTVVHNWKYYQIIISFLLQELENHKATCSDFLSERIFSEVKNNQNKKNINKKIAKYLDALYKIKDVEGKHLFLREKPSKIDNFGVADIKEIIKSFENIEYVDTHRRVCYIMRSDSDTDLENLKNLYTLGYNTHREKSIFDIFIPEVGTRVGKQIEYEQKKSLYSRRGT